MKSGILKFTLDGQAVSAQLNADGWVVDDNRELSDLLNGCFPVEATTVGCAAIIALHQAAETLNGKIVQMFEPPSSPENVIF